MTTSAFQDQIVGNHCFGCGAGNELGLRIKSYWTDDTKTVAECRFLPQEHHCAGPTSVLNGGIISTVIDCHSVCTAMAKAYDAAGREIGSGDFLWYATGQLVVNFKKPAAMDHEVLVVAKIEEVSPRKTWLTCELLSQGQVCADARVLAVRVTKGWGD